MATFGSASLLKLVVQHPLCCTLINQKDRHGSTPLHYVVGSQSFEIDKLKILVEANANLNIQDDKGTTPLHYAVSRGHTEAVRYLLGRDTLNVNLFSTANERSRLLPLTVALFPQVRPEILEILLLDRRQNPLAKVYIEEKQKNPINCPAWQAHFDYACSAIVGHIVKNDNDKVAQGFKKLELLMQHYHEKILGIFKANPTTEAMKKSILEKFLEPRDDINQAANNVALRISAQLQTIFHGMPSENKEKLAIKSLFDALQWHQSPPLMTVEPLVKGITKCRRKKQKMQQQEK
jgi:hypothetical protein